MNTSEIMRFYKWRKSFLAGTDKEVIKVWFDNYKIKINRLEKLGGNYEEEKMILTLCYIDGLSRFKYGRTSKRLFIKFLSDYSKMSSDLAARIYQWHRNFGVHHGRILGISKTGKLDLCSTPPQITADFVFEKLKVCLNKLAREMI